MLKTKKAGRPRTKTGAPPHPNNLATLMERDGVSTADIARAWKVENGDASQRVNGGVRITPDRAQRLKEVFGWSLSEIYSDKDITRTIKVPIRGSVPGGLPVEAIDVPPDEFIHFSIRKGNPKNMGALKVVGDSMNNIAPDGSYVIVDFSKTNPIDLDGKPVIAYAHGECTFKRLYLNPSILMPDSTNKSHRPMVLDGEWYILGQVMGVINSLED